MANGLPRSLRGVVGVVRFLWVSTAGYRLKPWCSPYLRWRVETYSGKAAATLTAGDFLRLMVSERGQMLRFAGWLGEMQELSAEREA